MQIHECYAWITLYKVAGQKKGFKIKRTGTKTPLVGQWLCGIN